MVACFGFRIVQLSALMLLQDAYGHAYAAIGCTPASFPSVKLISADCCSSSLYSTSMIMHASCLQAVPSFMLLWRLLAISMRNLGLHIMSYA